MIGTTSATPAEAVEPVSPPPGWPAPQHITYYSECRNLLGALGQKLTSALANAGLFAAAICTAIVTIRERFGPQRFEDVLLVFAGVVGLGMYWRIVAKYFLQLRYIGEIMEELEKEFPLPRIPEARPQLRLMTVLRHSDASFYRGWKSRAWVHGYCVALLLVVLAAAVVGRWPWSWP